MAYLTYLAGFDTAEIGAFSVAVAVSAPVGTSGTATITAGRYAHASLSATYGSLAYSAFRSQLQTQLNTAAAGNNFVVSYDTATAAYTIGGDYDFTLTWTGTGGTNLKRALGFTADLSGADSYTSTVRPYYVINAAIAARSQFSDVYEPDDIVVEAVADGGSPYAVSKDTEELWSDWLQYGESKAATLSASATASVPWTWQHFFKHLRGQHAFGTYDGTTVNVYKLRDKGASFNAQVRSRVVADYDDLWQIRFFCRHLA